MGVKCEVFEALDDDHNSGVPCKNSAMRRMGESALSAHWKTEDGKSTFCASLLDCRSP